MQSIEFASVPPLRSARGEKVLHPTDRHPRGDNIIPPARLPSSQFHDAHAHRGNLGVGFTQKHVGGALSGRLMGTLWARRRLPIGQLERSSAIKIELNRGDAETQRHCRLSELGSRISSADAFKSYVRNPTPYIPWLLLGENCRLNCQTAAMPRGKAQPRWVPFCIVLYMRSIC